MITLNKTMDKEYVIRTYNGAYVRREQDEMKLAQDLYDATFFDSEEYAYRYLMGNKSLFSADTTQFYFIECVVVVY